MDYKQQEESLDNENDCINTHMDEKIKQDLNLIIFALTQDENSTLKNSTKAKNQIWMKKYYENIFKCAMKEIEEEEN